MPNPGCLAPQTRCHGAQHPGCLGPDWDALVSKVDRMQAQRGVKMEATALRHNLQPRHDCAQKTGIDAAGGREEAGGTTVTGTLDGTWTGPGTDGAQRG